MRYWELLQKHAITTRGAVVVLVWGAMMHQMTDYSAGYLIVGTFATPDLVKYLFIALPLAQLVGFLFYPVAGVIADTWSRLGTMLLGLVLQTVATVIVTALVVTMYLFQEVRGLWYVWAVIIFCFGIIRVGLAMYEPNAMQMGSIQMPEASSDELSAYVHWFFWTLLLGQGVIDVLLIVLTLFLDYETAEQYTILYACFAQLASIPVVFILAWIHRKTLSLSLSRRNPLKQISGVLVYVMNTKHPRKRSAFTYGEVPSRMDLAKSRYGGPFSTEQVEDVKSFFRICVLLLSLSGFHFGLDETLRVTSNHIRAVASPEQTREYGFNFITIQVFGMGIFVIVVGIPVYQLLFKPLFYRFLTSMLKRIFIGLLLQLIGLCILQVLEAILSHHIETEYDVDGCTFYGNTTTAVTQNSSLPFHYQWIIVPQIFTGLTFLLVFLTVFEFILAQSPHNMQGLLIGVWYSAYSLNLTIAASEQAGCFVWLIGLIAFLSFLFLIIFIGVAKRYRKRERQEPSQHNQQQVVENVFERYLDQENAFETESYGSIVITDIT